MKTRDTVYAHRNAHIILRLGVIALLAGLAWMFVQEWRGASSASSDANGWVLAGEAGHNSNEAESDQPGDCEGTFGAPFGTDPAWVRVGGSTQPSAPFVEAQGQVLNHNISGELSHTKPNPFVTHTDAFYTHWSMDINAFLTLDPDYRHLLGNGNFADSFEGGERGLLEVEWERGGVPMFAWPSQGDRMTVWGIHIWDCGHGDTWLGGDNEYRTEIHPPVGWVVYRHSADDGGVPDNETKRTQDWVWYGPGDLKGTGAALIGSGTLNTPVEATVADAFFSTWGGNVPESVNGCDQDDILEFCHQDNEWRTSLLQQDYTFFVPAPPKPPDDPDAGAALMWWDYTDHCGAVPDSPGDPPGDDVEDVGEQGENIGAPICPIQHSVVEGEDANGKPGIFVTVLASEQSYTQDYVAFARQYRVAWDFIPAPAASAKKYQVDFHTLRVYNDSEPCGEDGEWVLSLAANDKWIHQVDGHGDSDTPFWTFDAVDDALCCIADCDPFQDYGIGESVEVTVQDDQPIQIYARGFDVDLVANDILPLLYEYRTGPGTYTSALAFGADGGEYRIIYTITDISDPAPTAGSLDIGDPHYGPNSDTGTFATRVSFHTPIEFVGSDGIGFQYRYWKDGDPKPNFWRDDLVAANGLDVDLTGIGTGNDGRYTIEFAAISGDFIVSERDTEYIELDTTPPTLTVPESFAIEATEAAGRIVTYEASAEDNLPGPVTFSCTPPSGSFFLIKHVKPVTCTATDAVGNTATKMFTIEVFSPFGYIPDFVALSHGLTTIGNGVVVQTGNVGAFDANASAPGGFEVVLGPSAILTGGPQVAAQSVQLQAGTQAGEVYYVDTLAPGVGTTYTAKSGYVPLFLGMPIFPAFAAGGADQTFSGVGGSLAAGTYGALKLNPNAVVTLTGGNYYFTSVELKVLSQLRFGAAATVHVTGRVEIANSVKVEPAAASGIDAHDIVFWVAGTDGTGGKSAFGSSADATLTINAYARNGTMSIGGTNVATGAFLGLRVTLGNNTILNLDSAFDYPYP